MRQPMRAPHVWGVLDRHVPYLHHACGKRKEEAPQSCRFNVAYAQPVLQTCIAQKLKCQSSIHANFLVAISSHSWLTLAYW